MKEVWKDVKGFEGLYRISNYGNVESVTRFDTLGRRIPSRIMKPQKNKKGYLHVKLTKGRYYKHYLIHRLVADAFIGERPAELEVNHIDENKENNRADNLEYVTHSQNIRHGKGIEKRAKAVIATLPDGTEEYYISATEAGMKLGVTKNAIGNAIYHKNRMKTACGRTWRFA